MDDALQDALATPEMPDAVSGPDAGGATVAAGGDGGEDAPHPLAIAFGRAAATYDTVVPFFSAFGAELVAAAGLAPGDRVADLACGRGAVLFPAVDAVTPGGSVTGVDLAPEMVALLGEAIDGMPGAGVRVGDAQALDDPDGTYDAVLCGFGIFFLPDPEAALVEWRRVLRDRGTVAVTTFDGATGGFPWVAPAVATTFGTEERVVPAIARAAHVREAMAAAGFTNVRTQQVRHTFTFADVEAVVAWYASHGGRLFLDAFDEYQHATFRRIAYERLEADHRVEGGYELDQAVDITVAQAG
jgi:ubiquinone/menaquinone biosynthesis C-methylase UbiE